MVVGTHVLSEHKRLALCTFCRLTRPQPNEMQGSAVLHRYWRNKESEILWVRCALSQTKFDYYFYEDWNK